MGTWLIKGNGYEARHTSLLFLVCNQYPEIQKTMVWQPCWMTERFVLSSNMAAMPLSFWISRDDWLQTKNRFLLAFLVLTVHKPQYILKVLEQLTNRNVHVKIFNCSVKIETKDCARSRPFQHKLQHHCFHGKVS